MLAGTWKSAWRELDKEKLAPLLRPKYNTLPDAFAVLGKPDEVGKLFAGFQRYLYQDETAA